MDIIDAHLHFYDLSNNINSWIYRQNDAPFLQQNCLPETLAKKANHLIHSIIHVEAHDSNVPTTVEIEWLQQAMQNITKFRYRHIALADVTLPHDEFCKTIDQISQYACVAGIRHTFSFHDNFKYSPCNSDVSSHPNITANLTYLRESDLIFDCQAYPYQINNLLPAIDASGVTCILDHLALPAWNTDNDSDHQLWQHMITELAERKNVFIKMSGLDMFKQRDEFDSVIDFCVNNFPSERLLYGSNHPVSFAGDYNAWYNYLYNHIDTTALTFAQKGQIFYNNAYNLFFKAMDIREFLTA